MSLKYAVIGAGAIGGYYGAKLVKRGYEVHFLFHSDFQYVSEHGLRVDSVDGDIHLHSVNAYQRVEDMPQCDVVLVCLKSTNNYLLKNLLRPLLHQNTLVVLIQNGLGLEEDLSLDFPNLDIAGAMAFICSNKKGKGHIAHLDEGSLSIGSYSCKNLALLDEVKSNFIESGVDCNIVDLEAARWKKLIWNIPYNGMTVVLNTTTDMLMNNINSRRLIKDLMLEVIRAANQIGKDRFVLPITLADNMLESTERMTPYSPSMKLDFDNKRLLEIEYIYNRPITKADKQGFDMKKAKMLRDQLLFLQERY